MQKMAQALMPMMRLFLWAWVEGGVLPLKLICNTVVILVAESKLHLFIQDVTKQYKKGP